jgi:hypothetical protein
MSEEEGEVERDRRVAEEDISEGDGEEAGQVDVQDKRCTPRH